MKYIHNKYIKFVGFITFFLFSIYFLYKGYYLFSFLFILISLICIFLFFKNEFILLAILKLYKQDIIGLQKYLGYIKYPNLQLTKNQISYFYFLNGILYLKKKNILKSEYYMKKALNLGLKFKQDIALANINLAITSLYKGDKERAKLLLLKAQKMDIHGILKNQINFIKTNMNKNKKKYIKYIYI